MKNKLLVILALAVVVGGGAFYGGMKYGQSKCSRPQNFSADKQMFQPGDDGFAGGFSREKADNIGGMINGKIVARDEKSLTVELLNGGSKIVFYSDTTEITKSISGSLDDLKENQRVIINGQSNSDGSITAKTIQLISNN